MTRKNDKRNADDPRAKREYLRRQEIHLSIIIAAEKVIIQKGYTAMTMDDVARGACLSKATLYKYIPSKDRILFEIACRYLNEEETKFRQVVDSGTGAAEKLRAIIAEMLHFHRKKRNIGRMLMLDRVTLKFLRRIYEGDGKTGNEYVQRDIAFLKRKNLGIMKLVARIVEEGVVSGEFRPVDPMETVYFLNSFLVGIDHTWLWGGGMINLPEDELLEKIFLFIFSSLRKREDDVRTDRFRSSGKQLTDAPAKGRKESKNA